MWARQGTGMLRCAGLVVRRGGRAPPSAPGGPLGAGSARPLGCVRVARPAHPAHAPRHRLRSLPAPAPAPLIVASSA